MLVIVVHVFFFSVLSQSKKCFALQLSELIVGLSPPSPLCAEDVQQLSEWNWNENVTNHPEVLTKEVRCFFITTTIEQ